MCGLIAIVHRNNRPIKMENLRESVECLVHRGPDDKQVYIENHVGMGHTRLAIQDRSKLSKQPMISQNKREVLIYNGEIYNGKELKNYLQNRGISLRTNGDTEILLESLALLGSKVLPKLNGMFSFVCYNTFTKTLLIARDRYGTKPLYYYEDEKQILFASEIKAILAYLKKTSFEPPTINPRIIREYLHFQNVISDETLITNIKSLPPGCFMEIKLNSQNSALKIQKFWDLPLHAEVKRNTSRRDLEFELEFLLENSVKNQSIGEASFGSFLSGGIDSSLITLFARKNFENLNTYNVAFDINSEFKSENFINEKDEASTFAKSLKSNHTTINVGWHQIPEFLGDIAKSLEETKVGQCYPNYFAAKRASIDSRVVFSGTAGDEIFGGYPWRYSVDGNFGDWESLLENLYQKKNKLLEGNNDRILLKSVDFDDINRPKELFKSYFDKYRDFRISEESVAESLLYFDFKTFLPGLLLVEDKLGMAHSLETRFPFLDNAVVDFGSKLNLQDKIERDAETGIWRGKILLRNIMANKFSIDIAQRPKAGFSGPDAYWFRNELVPYIENFFINENPIWNYLDRHECHRIFLEHVEKKVNRRHFLWSILFLNSLIASYWH